ncbi:MAG: T9SS type A sorting domain-containing protein [Bacteroidales bacterium]|nr:T9SS type A sorting domain-containing protein [Bacteroidales bacterium]
MEDSTHNIVLSGDTLSMYAVGESLQQIDFEIEQTAAAEDMNLVFPINLQLMNDDQETFWTTPFYVTDGQPEIDTIGSIGFRTRVDTLFKYLEKAENANWELEWVDGEERADLKRGDILKVTAQDGTVKNYFLAVDSIPEPSHNATLSAITWPDAPAFLRESPQWDDDTIPGFEGQTRFIYDVLVPYGTKTIPALKAIPSNLNAKVKEERATLITGTLADRTSTFTVTAEDDTTINVYTVTFSVEKPSELVQPFTPHPIISRLIYRAYGTDMWVEISNPGNQPVDMSKYMIVKGPEGLTPPDIISRISDDYANRYDAYIPGYDYQSEIEWSVQPGIVEKDLTVNPTVEPGGSFVLSRKLRRLNEYWWDSDIIFTNITDIPEEIDKKVVITPTGNGPSVMFMHVRGTSYLLLEIINDSIRNGSKGIKDIEDFKIVDVWGDYTGTNWTPAGENVNVGNPKWNFDRKPEFWQGDTLPGYNGSWGETAETSEWVCRNDIYYDENGYDGFDGVNGALREGVGSHVFLPITVYNSTVTSYAYIVSDGYQSPQSIEGVSGSSTVADFLANINKNDPDQTLAIIGKSDEDAIANEDTLMVTSADGNNVTKYALFTGALDSDATLQSSVYDISADGSSGVIAGIPVGASVAEVLSNITKPQTALLNIIDDEDQLIPLQVRNYDTVYVNTAATNNVFFEVLAQDGVTKITYQLQLDVSDSDAFVFSDLFEVDQDLQSISLIPTGIRVDEFFASLTVNDGASIKLNDKTGVEVTVGNVAWDDIIVVTSPDGSTTRIYALNFLNEPAGTDAYVVSDVFTVDQLNAVISEIQQSMDVNVFFGLIRVSTGATATLLDADGNEKTTGQIMDTDQLRVVSGNGEVTVTYDLSLVVGINPYVQSNFAVYPNPARDVIFLEGVNENSEVVIRNILGVVVKQENFRNASSGEITVTDIPAGIYFIYLQNKNYQSNPLKVVIQ